MKSKKKVKTNRFHDCISFLLEFSTKKKGGDFVHAIILFNACPD